MTASSHVALNIDRLAIIDQVAFRIARQGSKINDLRSMTPKGGK
jgi:hypothetical protein